MLSHVRLFATPWTVACQVPLSRGFSRREYWSGLPCPSPEDLHDPGIKPWSPALQADSLPFLVTGALLCRSSYYSHSSKEWEWFWSLQSFRDLRTSPFSTYSFQGQMGVNQRMGEGRDIEDHKGGFYGPVRAVTPATSSHISLSGAQSPVTTYIKVLVAQSCLILCDPMGCSPPPGSSAHGILQGRILEWVAIPFSRESCRLRDWTCISCIMGRFFFYHLRHQGSPLT